MDGGGVDIRKSQAGQGGTDCEGPAIVSTVTGRFWRARNRKETAGRVGSRADQVVGFLGTGSRPFPFSVFDDVSWRAWVVSSFGRWRGK